MLLEAREIERHFQVGARKIVALDRISTQIDNGEFLIITGPSGSGKSTLLNILSGLDTPSHGVVNFKGRPLSTMDSQQRAHLRNESFGFIFQTPHLLFDKTVLENTLLPFSYGAHIDRDSAVSRCLELLRHVGLEHLAHRYPNTLSGGEMQRIVFARALSREPDVIFADEPTGNLDGENSKKLLQLPKEQSSNGRTVIMVTHDREAAACGSSTLHLDKFTQAAEEQVP